MLFSFGENGNLNKIDFDKLISGLSSDDLAIVKDDFVNSLFNSIDTNKDKKLDRSEISIFEQKIKQLAGDDKSLSVEEAKLFEINDISIGQMENLNDGKIDGEGNYLIHSKVRNFFSFLEALSVKTEGVKKNTEKNGVQTVVYTNDIKEIKGPNNSLVIKDKSGKVIFDSEAVDVNKPVSPVTDAEYYMINYLKNQLEVAKDLIESADDDSSITADLVNWWYNDVSDYEFSKENLAEIISEYENNITELERAAEISPEEFRKVCKNKLNIEYDSKKVEEFMLQAQEYDLIAQHFGILHKARHAGLYTANRDYDAKDIIEGHAVIKDSGRHVAVDASAQHREYAKLFIEICQAMGYTQEDIVEIYKETLERYNAKITEYNKNNNQNLPIITSLGFDKLQADSENFYLMTQRKDGGYDVAHPDIYPLIFKCLTEKLEEDFVLFYDLENNGDNSKTIDNFVDSKSKAYHKNLSEVMGSPDIIDFSKTYSNELREDIAAVNAAYTMITMIATLATGGLSLAANGLKCVTFVARSAKALNVCNKIIKIANYGQKILSVAGTVAMLNPVALIDQMFSEKGMTPEAFCAWSKGVLQNLAFMGVGMAASNFAMRFASWYKAGQLVKFAKNGGSSFDELMNAVKSTPHKFPPDLIKSLNGINRTATLLQISAETFMDCGFSAALNYSLNGENLTTYDALMSLAFAINGSFVEKTMREQNTQNAKIEYINKALDDFKKMSVEEQNMKLEEYRRQNNIDMDISDLRNLFNDFNLNKNEVKKIVETGDSYKVVTLAHAIYGNDGCILQKELSVLSDDAKARYIQDALRDFDLSYNDAWQIVEYMDAIAKNEKIIKNEMLETLEIRVKSTKKMQSVSEEFNRLSKVEDLSLPSRVQTLEEVSASRENVKIDEIKQKTRDAQNVEDYQRIISELEQLPLSKYRNKAIAEVIIAKQQVEQRPAPLVISEEAKIAAQGPASDLHLKSDAEIDNFYNTLTDDQKAIIDQYGIEHDNIFGIHGVLKLKLSRYDTPETIESRYQTTLSKLKNGTIELEDYQKNYEADLDYLRNLQYDLMGTAKRERKLVIITGRAGGGKSTIAKQLGLEDGYYFPDADDLKAFLPNYKEYGAGYVHGLSVALNTVFVENAFANGLNTVFQTTGWHSYVDEIIKKAVDAGYTDIQLIHTDVTAGNSIKRSFSRAEDTGRTVDPASIETSTYIDFLVEHCFYNQSLNLNKISIYDNNGSGPECVGEIPLGYYVDNPLSY